MVPSLERSEYMEELRNIADNIVRERLEHSEVHPPAHATPAANVLSCDVAHPCPQSPASIGTFGKASASEDVQRPVEYVGPAFHIPMTQEKSLEELPSQLDFEWQDSVSPNSTPAHVTTRNLGGEMDIVGTPRPTTVPHDMDVDTFVEVSQIAQEAVVDATHQPPSQVPHSGRTTTDTIGDASQI